MREEEIADIEGKLADSGVLLPLDLLMGDPDIFSVHYCFSVWTGGVRCQVSR